MNKQLSTITDNICQNYLQIKPEENVLVITNPEIEPFSVAQSFYNSSLACSPHTNLLMQQSRTNRDTMEEFVSKSIALNPDVVIASSRYSLGRDPIGRKHNYLLGKSHYDNILYYLKAAKKMRAIWFYVYSVDRFIKTNQINTAAYLSLSQKLLFCLNSAVQAHITSSHGCNLFLDISNPKRKAQADFDGSLKDAGKGVNLPFGEVFICPTIGGIKGEAVIDGSVHYGKTHLLLHPLTLKFSDGYLSSFSSQDQKAQTLVSGMLHDGINCRDVVDKTMIRTYQQNAKAIGEFGIGINPNATVSGEMIEDEKSFGTCHIALGASYDGDPALYHSDMVITNPTVTLIYPDKSKKIILSNHKFNL